MSSKSSTPSPASSPILVMKFGGTSVANADRIRNAARLATSEPGPVVVVTSALAGVTDELIRLGLLACEGARAEVTAAVGVLRSQHLAVAREITGVESGALATTLGGLLDDLEHLLVGIELVQENSPRTADLLVSFGERLAAPIVAAAIEASGGKAEAVDARSLIVLDDGRAPAAVDMAESRRRTRAAIPPNDDVIAVVTGFIAATPDGRTATLGRGGSDYTASLVGAFLDARAIWIWTDVDGVMTTDPRVVPEARVMAAITYREAAEMAYFGSKVLHPSTMIPAVDRRIPIVIRNSLDPAQPGTRISDEPSPDALGVKAVSAIGDLALVTVEGSGMVGVPGVAERVFATTARLGISVYMVSQASSEHNISFVVGHD
ncbi:MAG: aspartate kinase, partial [Phycisphaerae bacterium]|nr:aspartate kinase [Phycisphaerae bacterium]